MNHPLTPLEILAEVCRQQLLATQGDEQQADGPVNTSLTPIARPIINASASNQPVPMSNLSSLPEFTIHAKNILHQWSEENDNNLNPDQDTQRKLATLASITYNQVSRWFRDRRKRSKVDTSGCRLLSQANVEILEAFYRKKRYPNSNDRELLAMQLGITERQVSTWFYNQKKLYNMNADYGPLTREQKRLLEKWVNENNHNLSPSRCKTHELAGLIGASYQQVYQWFYRQRRKPTENKARCVVASAASLQILETSFQGNKYPDRTAKEQLATTLQHPINYVINWFVIRRRKQRQLELLKVNLLEE